MVAIESYNFSNILLAILLTIISTLVIFVFYRRRAPTRNCVLLTGLCDSGKTLIFSQLLHEKFFQTHTSIKENIGSYSVNKSTFRIIDIPGHERLRHKFIDQYKHLTRAVLFVVDSSTIQQDVRDVAEFLYDILSDTTLARNLSNIVVLCNKQDYTFSKGSKAIKSILEKELNTLRVTKSNQLDYVDQKIRQAASLGPHDVDFSFANFPLKVDFVETTATNKDGSIDIDKLKNWLATVA